MMVFLRFGGCLEGDDGEWNQSKGERKEEGMGFRRDGWMDG